MKTSDYIAVAKQRNGIQSDYALAKLLGTGSTTVASWNVGRSVPDTRFAVKLAELAAVDPLKVLAEIEIERAERKGAEDAASFWRDYLCRITETVRKGGKEYVSKATGSVITGILVGAILATPDPVNASSISPSAGEDSPLSDSVYYVNQKRKRRNRRRSGAMATIARTLYGFSARH